MTSKNKALYILVIIFFLAINTRYYWISKVGMLSMPIDFILLIVYLGLAIMLLLQVFLYLKERLTDKRRIYIIGLLSVVLSLTFYKPFGLIDFDKLEGEDILVAQSEGAGNCSSTFKLKDNFVFKEKIVCFGVLEIKGTYKISNDTIYFDYSETTSLENKKYEFAVVEELEHYTENPLALKLYMNKADTIGHYYYIGKNELQLIPKKKKKQ
jgi:hypothetical protein